MSGLSTQGVGAAAWADADVENALSAAAIKTVLVENLVILHPPGKWLCARLIEQTANNVRR
jgi:hypothetical protein